MKKTISIDWPSCALKLGTAQEIHHALLDANYSSSFNILHYKQKDRLPLSTNKQCTNRRHFCIMGLQMHKRYVMLHPEESTRQRGQNIASLPSVPSVLQIAFHGLYNTSVSFILVVQNAIIHHHTWHCEIYRKNI